MNAAPHFGRRAALRLPPLAITAAALVGCSTRRSPRSVPIESMAVVAAQQSRLVLTYVSVLAQPDLSEVTVDETPQRAWILVREWQPERVAGATYRHTTEVRLKWPIGDREITDSSNGQPIALRVR